MRFSTHDSGASSPSMSALRKRCDHATSGRQRSWSTATIMTVIATIAHAMARRSPFSMATAMYEPIPGRRKSRSPSVKASLTVRKNQPPAIDIIEFHTRPITDDDSSTVRKRFQKEKRCRRATSWSSSGIERSEPTYENVMFQTCAVKIMRMQASSRPTFVFGKSATMPRTRPGRKPSTGIPCPMSRSGSITFSARLPCAAIVP